MRELITFSSDSSQSRSREFKVGIRSLPYLADHGFQDMIVLPGSFYIEMALLVHREIFKETPTILLNVKFQNPVILSDEDAVIKVKIRENEGKRVEYSFFESGSAENHTPYFAKVEVDPDRIAAAAKPAYEFSIEEFKTRAASVIDAEEFYHQLRVNGNQYGPRFQNLSAIWRSEDQALGKVSVPSNQPQGEHYLHPTLIDSITQLLAAFTIEKG
jgi:myxalamid-type polyketide synthase MxaF